MNKLDLDTWIISDTHFGHDNIVKYCNRPEDHNEIMFDEWWQHISNVDTVLHLGDLFMGMSRDEAARLWLHLPGDKHMIRGNHDKQTDVWYDDHGFKIVGKPLGKFKEEDETREGKPYVNSIMNHGLYKILDNKRILFSHYPDTWLKDWDINIHGHVHNNQPSRRVTSAGKDYRNVSVEVMDYKPARLRDVLDKV